MESITIKVDDNVAKDIDHAMEQGYSTKTEFIREAIRDKINNIKKDQVLLELRKYFGKSKIKTTDKQNRKVREKVGKEFAKKFGIKLD